VGSVADISEIHAASIFRDKMKLEVPFTSEISAALPMSTWCKQSRTELISTINDSESIK
jgi:hypothetical protein